MDLAQTVESINDEGPTPLNSFGNLCFVVIQPGGKEKAVFVRKDSGIRALRMLEAIVPQGELSTDLEDMRSQLLMLPK
jgi:hypothetical protein